MRYNLCTISFRHELVSFQELLRYALDTGFNGIELWGVHAKALLRQRGQELEGMLDEMFSYGLEISMLSDYIPLMGNLPMDVLLKEWQDTVQAAKAFHTNKLRIFAGNLSSQSLDEKDWELCTERLKILCAIAEREGVYTVVETHPGTAADGLDSTLQLLRQTGHPALKLNLDFLHIWESGADPLAAFERLKPWIVNIHLKNVESRQWLEVFSPNNIYSPSGSRRGIVPLADGEMDCQAIMKRLILDPTRAPVSLEWFGANPFQILKSELGWLKGLESDLKLEKVEVTGT
ncbi:sugar phosphate isomerase/epimerase family protein [Paenibacillus sp. FSL H3-0333]|uniref:sugar phosphate isomerase/epimerase family protein n=1 Tax=Paenibacillus sp. FSL H3-0333 TaxID=2921373 RepID=UPI0030FACA85